MFLTPLWAKCTKACLNKSALPVTQILNIGASFRFIIFIPSARFFLGYKCDKRRSLKCGAGKKKSQKALLSMTPETPLCYCLGSELLNNSKVNLKLFWDIKHSSVPFPITYFEMSCFIYQILIKKTAMVAYSMTSIWSWVGLAFFVFTQPKDLFVYNVLNLASKSSGQIRQKLSTGHASFVPFAWS